MVRWLAPPLLFATFACSTEVSLEASEVCDNVGYAIASRTLDCTKSSTLANARFDRFSSHLTCAPTRPVSSHDFGCTYAVGAATCPEVIALGDDLAAWLARSSTCARLFPGGVR